MDRRSRPPKKFLSKKEIRDFNTYRSPFSPERHYEPASPKNTNLSGDTESKLFSGKSTEMTGRPWMEPQTSFGENRVATAPHALRKHEGLTPDQPFS